MFHPNIPQAGDDPKDSQADLLDNFGKINADFAANHVALTEGGNNGYHKLVAFTDASSGDVSVSGIRSALYPKKISGIPQLFFRNVDDIFQLTKLPIETSGSGHRFSVVTPWGLTLKFGFVENVSSSGTAVSFDTPFTTAVYSIICSLGAEDTFVYVDNTSVTNAGFTLFTQHSGIFAYFFAIGT